jgi:hypothetical protein
MSRISSNRVAVLLAISAIASMQSLASTRALAASLGNGEDLGKASVAASAGGNRSATRMDQSRLRLALAP